MSRAGHSGSGVAAAVDLPAASSRAKSRCGSLRVYSRRCGAEATPCRPWRSCLRSPTPSPPPAHQRLLKVRKPVVRLLPKPVVHKRRSKGPAFGSLPRRSRRVAGAGPCSPGPITSESQRRVIRSLGFDCREKIDPKTQDDYFILFGKPLS